MERILVVDDSRLMRSLIVDALSDVRDLEIEEAASAEQAVTLASRAPETYLVALLDLVLPDAIDGEIVTRIDALGIPSIVFTSEVNEDVRRRCIRGGVIDYIIKDDSRAITEVTRLVTRIRENRRISVLAVDDSAAVRAQYERLLRNYRFTVFTASHGTEALKVMAAHGEISLVITDYDMPEMDGFTLIQELRQHHDNSELAIIGCTGRNDAVVTARLLKAGADDFISKPFWNEEFFRRVIRSVENLERVRRLRELNETKDRFVGMAAHDLRSPLANTISMMELLLDGLAGPLQEEQEKLLRMVDQGSRSMMKLISDLLDVAAIESGRVQLEITAVPLRDALTGQINLQRAAADRKAVTVHLEEEPSAPWDAIILEADTRALEQIISNVLSNAIKYTPAGSRVTIAPILKKEKNLGGFAICDQGTGIPHAEQPKLFRSFERLSTRPTAGESSHGLGLAIVKRLMDAQGGSISYHDAPGGGGCFQVLLPAKKS